MAFCSGSYLARPKEFLIFVLDVFFGTGILTTTWVANSFSEKLAIILRLMEHLEKKEEVSNDFGKHNILCNSQTVPLTLSAPPLEQQETT